MIELSPHSTKAICPHCGKRVSKKGLLDHIKETHEARQAPPEKLQMLTKRFNYE